MYAKPDRVRQSKLEMEIPSERKVGRSDWTKWPIRPQTADHKPQTADHRRHCSTNRLAVLDDQGSPGFDWITGFRLREVEYLSVDILYR